MKKWWNVNLKFLKEDLGYVSAKNIVVKILLKNIKLVFFIMKLLEML